ncbi:MAG: class I SAM-dependent RNA methyltransferase [Gemmatimonadetes bacterium]|nr:class I SAM-dependent RNA methyltransferase [Gemmatimonadota bacterium]
MAVAGTVSAPLAAAVGDRVRLRIRGVASGGAGSSELPDGRVAFVHRTAPGDVVEARVSRLRPRWAEAQLLEVVEAGPGRVRAPCPHYATCAGCSLQHLAYAEQLAWKRLFVADALARIGGVEVPPPDVVASPARTGYRNRVTLTVLHLGGGRSVAGFHALGRPDRVVDVGGACLLPEPPILAAWEALRAACDGARVLPEGRELRVTLRALESGVALIVKGGAAGGDPALLLERVPGLVSVWHQPPGHDAPRRLAGDVVYETWGEERIPMSGHAFLQVNRGAAEALAAHVLAQAGAPGKAVDAYCGVGGFGRALARRGWRVEGIEPDPDACAGARHLAPGDFTVRQGTVEDHLAEALPADLVILNPPRTGLDARVPPVLAQRRPGRVVYVSCDPATLARDVARLGGAFSVTGLACFDLFPQTSHVETVAVLSAGGPR